MRCLGSPLGSPAPREPTAGGVDRWHPGSGANAAKARSSTTRPRTGGSASSTSAPTADGRRRRPKVFGRTRAEVRTKLDELRTASKAGQAVDQRAVTFGTLADEWLEKGLPAETAPTTRSNYETLINTHLKPGLGKKKVVDLRPGDIEAVLAGMAAKGYSTRTMRLALNLTKTDPDVRRTPRHPPAQPRRHRPTPTRRRDPAPGADDRPGPRPAGRGGGSPAARPHHPVPAPRPAPR